MQFCEADRKECTYELIVGEWESVFSEIPDFEGETCTFTADRKFFYETSMDGEMYRNVYPFRLRGLKLEYTKEYCLWTSAWMERGSLVFQPEHGMRTVYRRVDSALEK